MKVDSLLTGKMIFSKRNLCMFAMMALTYSCSRASMMAPSHVGLSNSMEVEIQKGTEMKMKPKVSLNTDWNF